MLHRLSNRVTQDVARQYLKRPGAVAQTYATGVPRMCRTRNTLFAFHKKHERMTKRRNKANKQINEKKCRRR